jgi:predicted aconitase with swiveling domain
MAGEDALKGGAAGGAGGAGGACGAGNGAGAAGNGADAAGNGVGGESGAGAAGNGADAAGNCAGGAQSVESASGASGTGNGAGAAGNGAGAAGDGVGGASGASGAGGARRFRCHKISEGVGEGEAILSKDEIMFYLVRPEDGVVIEKAHDLEGRSVARKVIVFPGGKGSSVVQSDGLYQLMMKENQPQAMIIQHAETVLVAGAIIMEIPLVDKVDPAFYDVVKDGDRVRVDATNGVVEIL